jgi:hypothetical protein
MGLRKIERQVPHVKNPTAAAVTGVAAAAREGDGREHDLEVSAPNNDADLTDVGRAPPGLCLAVGAERSQKRDR